MVRCASCFAAAAQTYPASSVPPPLAHIAREHGVHFR
jgi:hypothetical protein